VREPELAREAAEGPKSGATADADRTHEGRKNSRAVNTGIRNEWFERWGLLSLDVLCATRCARGLPSPETSP
jgi:hypothetical protein